MKTTHAPAHHFNVRSLNIPRDAYHLVAVMVVLFGFALCLNALYQAKAAYYRLLPETNIAVFLEKGKGALAGDISRRIQGFGGVKNVRFVGPQDALNDAFRSSPWLREIMISGDNPFLPYLLVYPAQASPAAALAMREKVQALPGVEDVRYDERLFSVVSGLSSFITWYTWVLFACAAVAVAMGLAHFIRKWVFRRADYSRYLFIALGGLVCGFLVAICWRIGARALSPALTVYLPLKYLLLLPACGIVAALMTETK